MSMPFLPKLPRLFPITDQQRANEHERTLLRMEAEIGGKLFGPVPKGHTRRFFRLDSYTWIWHEEWQEKGQRKVITTRYTVRPEGVIKSQDGLANQRVSLNEARNLYRAVELYEARVGSEYDRLLQSV